MKQKTLDKMNRALKALDVARESFANEITFCNGDEERKAFYNEYFEVMNLEAAMKRIIGKAETEIYIKNQKSVEEMLGVQG